jgi:hypothetical protein
MSKKEKKESGAKKKRARVGWDPLVSVTYRIRKSQKKIVRDLGKGAGGQSVFIRALIDAIVKF